VLNDETGYEELYKVHYRRVQRLCRLLLQNVSEAEEVEQEIFLKMLRQYRAESWPTDWRAWLTRVTVNACHDRQRSTWWNRWRLSDGEDAATELPSFNLTPEQEVLGREERDRIWRCFQQLSPRQQEIFILRYLEGWSTDEVASVLGLTNSSVKQHLFRAVRRLRKSLGDRS